MGQVRLNDERWKAFCGDKSLAVLATELDLDKATISRANTGNALPGNRFIANVLLNVPGSFGTLFVVEASDE